MRLNRAATMIVCVFLGLAVARAQDDRGNRGRDQRGERGGGRGGDRGRGGGEGARGGGRGGAPDVRRLLEYDVDGDLLVDEKELRTGLKELQENAATAVVLVLKGLDADGDARLGESESKALGEVVRTLSSVRRADRNRDWQLNDDEMGELWEQLATACQQHSQRLLQRFDKDGDGQLDEQETAEAKKQMPERGRGGAREKGRSNRKERGGDREGDRAGGRRERNAE